MQAQGRLCYGYERRQNRGASWGKAGHRAASRGSRSTEQHLGGAKEKVELD